jgi:ferredoxin--NADP+ reductase
MTLTRLDCAGKLRGKARRAAGASGGAAKEGRAGFDALAEARGLDVVTFRDWKKIEAAETERAREGAPREKFVAVEHMIKAAGKD